jgi:L-2-hydroxyglutarate oxidase LhgO
MSTEIKTDISIVGAGVTGLMLTNKLTDLGYRVALVDRQSCAAGGPSTKNEGWLHKGTYHATSIANEDQSVQETVLMLALYKLTAKINL